MTFTWLTGALLNPAETPNPNVHDLYVCALLMGAFAALGCIAMLHLLETPTVRQEVMTPIRVLLLVAAPLTWCFGLLALAASVATLAAGLLMLAYLRGDFSPSPKARSATRRY